MASAGFISECLVDNQLDHEEAAPRLILLFLWRLNEIVFREV